MWASSNLGADAFLMVYDITSKDSLDALQYFDELVSMEAETRLDNADRANRAGLSPNLNYGSTYGGGGGRIVPPIKIVAGNKCDLQERRQVPAAQGLEWARKRGCGFMETSARLEVNIEETFALIVRRVAEARRQAESGMMESLQNNARGMTKPLSPIPHGGEFEKRGLGFRNDGVGRASGGFWRSLRCW